MFLECVRDDIIRRSLIPPGARFGRCRRADSTALLLTLWACSQFGWAISAHYNHHMRLGADDEAFAVLPELGASHLCPPDLLGSHSSESARDERLAFCGGGGLLGRSSSPPAYRR